MFGRREIQSPQKVEAGLGALVTVHSGVFPLDRYWSPIANRVQDPETGFPRHVAPAHRYEIEAPAWITPRQVRAEGAIPTVQLELGVLAVDMEDAIAEVPQEGPNVDALPEQV